MRYSPYVPSNKRVSLFIEPYIEGKVVYDLGAGEGNIALDMSKVAKEVVAVESNKDRAEVCRSKGLSVIEEDFLSIDLSKAEVLYVFQGYLGSNHLTHKLKTEGWRGTVICNAYPLSDILKKPNKADEEIIYRGEQNINLYIYHLKITTTIKDG